VKKEALRDVVEALPSGAPFTLPREWILELMDQPGSGSAKGPALLTVADVAQRYRLGRSTARTLIEQGVFPGSIKLSWKWLVPAAGIVAFEQAKVAEQPPSVPVPPRRRGRGLDAWRHEKAVGE
jgi:helix-turn-helix protein